MRIEQSSGETSTTPAAARMCCITRSTDAVSVRCTRKARIAGETSIPVTNPRSPERISSAIARRVESFVAPGRRTMTLSMAVAQRRGAAGAAVRGAGDDGGIVTGTPTGTAEGAAAGAAADGGSGAREGCRAGAAESPSIWVPLFGDPHAANSANTANSERARAATDETSAERAEIVTRAVGTRRICPAVHRPASLWRRIGTDEP